ncbi:DUF1194 domain-containing protein [Shumkonia mesophila]|uniref:DUF1194 domain-containing protein n=1 Tax=Shumkonia mesophila TaxID=2838854 RepID=UPI002934B274|nr:DUF1194 domain-containing protein [Shumkonia mesophila]
MTRWTRLAPPAVLAAALSLLAFFARPAAAEPVDLELVLAADGSGSIDEDEFMLQRRGYAEAIASRAVLAAITGGRHGAIALAFVEWAAPDSVHTIVDWMVIRGPAEAADFAARLMAAPRVARGYNSISEAIAHSTRLIETNAHQGARKVIDVSGDGPQINGRPLPLMRAAALNAGITINALLIRRAGGGVPGPRGEALGEHYANEVIGGFGAFLMTAEGEANFAEAIRRKMIQEIADAGPTGAPPGTPGTETARLTARRR